MKKRNVIQFSPGVGDAAEKLINATVSDVLSEQESFQNNAIELKSLMEAMRSTIATWYQIQMTRE